jgi:preprotein translocase subunit SecB
MSETDNNYATFFASLQLKDIRLVESSAKRDEGFTPPASIESTRTVVVTKMSGNQYLVRCSFSVVSTTEKPDQARMDLLSTYEVSYTAEGELDERAKGLLRDNAALACWPLFRTSVRSLTSDMGFPPLVLSLLKATFEPPAASEKAGHATKTQRRPVSRTLKR